jgi:hypothetical protein
MGFKDGIFSGKNRQANCIELLIIRGTFKEKKLASTFVEIRRKIASVSIWRINK